MNNDTALITLVAIVFAGLIWLIKAQQTQSNTVMKDLSKNIASQNVLAASQIQSLQERDERDHTFQSNVNASFIKQNKLLNLLLTKSDTVIANSDRNYEATISKQTVENQTVNHQVIKQE